ncbi:hypothetical protein LBMAG52_19040 [Planctomycetia bacterium]|nr:hypothetical protein LBMAG52_19040 [Planctomycetia bacterium]
MTNGVAKLYDRLTAKERTSAFLSAAIRGDDLEAQRLNATAPRQTERRRHHRDRVQAIWNVAATVRIQQLATLANLWHAQSRLAWALDQAEADGESADVVNADVGRDVRLWRAFVDVCCWRLSVSQTAWGIVCERLGIAPEFLDQFGECIALQLTEAGLANNTPTPETVRERLAEFGESADGLTTAERIAAGWLDVFAGLTGGEGA